MSLFHSLISNPALIPVTEIFTTSGYWSCPAGVFSVHVQAWGGGSAGEGRTTSGSGGGGGGGAYAEGDVVVVPGTLYAFTIAGLKAGTTGVGANGGDTQWDAGLAVKAVGGVGGGQGGLGVGGAGGLASNCIGSIKFDGGNGGEGHINNAGIGGGGGGGGAGTLGGGGNGTNGSASGGVTAAGGVGGSLLGGNGGVGKAPAGSGDGSPGFVRGGAGGGAVRGSGSRSGGFGHAGEIRITYTTPGAISEVDTNASQQQAFLVIGDSTAAGNSGGPTGPTPTAGTSYYWRRSNGTVIEIGATDLNLAAVPPAGGGSQWPQFAITFNSLTAKKAVVIPTGVGGTNTTDWYEYGSYWGVCLSDAQRCMHAMGVNRLKAVFIHLGLNDLGSATALSTVESNINSLVTRLQTYFPGADIVFNQPGRFGAILSERTGQIRGYIKNAAINNTNVHVLGGTLAVAGAGQIQGDNVHLQQTGQNNVGSMMARWCFNTAYDKWARMIISSHFDELSTARKALIAPLDANHLASYLNHEMIFMFKTTLMNNTFLDWALLTCNLPTGLAPFTADSHIESNGTSTYRLTGYVPAWSDYKSTLTDRFIAAKVKVNSTAAGTAATLFGAASAAGINALQIAQTVSNTLGYKVNDNTLTEDGTDTAFQNDTEYMIARNGGNKYLFKNAVEIDNAAVAATVQTSIETVLGANNNNTVVDSFIAGQYEYLRAGKHVGTDHAAFITFLENILDHWND